MTLLELLVVLSIVAIATVAVVWSLRDPVLGQLQQEAARLAALLEGGRADSRARNQALRWRVQGSGFQFEGEFGGPWPDRWLFESTQAQVKGADSIVLGPEPVIGPQAVMLMHTLHSDRRLWVSTDGARPFEVRTSPAAEPSVHAVQRPGA